MTKAVVNIIYGSSGSAKNIGCEIWVISEIKLTIIAVIRVGVLSKRMERRKSKRPLFHLCKVN